MPSTKDSTRETYLGYIERTTKPTLGSMSIAKLSVPHLKTLYAELRVLAIRSRLVRSVRRRDSDRTLAPSNERSHADLGITRPAVPTSAVLAEPAGTRVVTLADRPDLAVAILGVLSSRWPTFVLAGRPGHNVDLSRLAVEAPGHQVLLVDTADEVLGVGRSVPLEWDGAVSGVPTGWDAAVTAGAELLDRGSAATAMCALAITITPTASGRGLAAGILSALRNGASSAGAAALIVPVRPVLKARYPLTPMARYLTWRTEDDRVFDPWLRLHLSLGGPVLGLAFPSMTISGTVATWQHWIDLLLPDSGEYIIPGGLAPLAVDRDADTGVYREPNVWIMHRTGI